MNDLESYSRSLEMALCDIRNVCHLVLVVCSNSVSILHLFRDTVTFTVYENKGIFVVQIVLYFRYGH